MSIRDREDPQKRRSNRKPAAQGRWRGVDSEFINLELNKEQSAACRTWREDSETVINMWSELLEEGYRVNTKYDDYSSSYAAFIIPDEQSDNSGFILTGRGGNPYRAVSEALFKHFAVLKGLWGNASDLRPNRDDPDF